MKRELIYMDAKSSKFWTIEVSGCQHTVSYGRIGSAGQSSTKTFPKEEAALKDAEKLVKEKLGKGYVDAQASDQAASDAGLIPMVAFSNINRREEIFSNAGTFIGRRVVDYDPEKPVKNDVVYRFRSSWDDNNLIAHLERYLALPGSIDVTALVFGAWHGDDSGASPDNILECLTANKDRIPNLAALFLGDITSEENEMSWINQTDLSPLLKAFPKLQLLRTRGGEGLALTEPSHPNLRALAMETGGMDVSVIASLSKADLPSLEYLELWLGTEDYGATATVRDLQPILSGKLFPKLKYLGLRNSYIADEVAIVVAASPVVQQIETLDLSLGVLTDDGGQALLKLTSPTLKKLSLHYNYLSHEMIRQLKALPITVDASRPSDMEDEDEEDRFVAVGE